MNLKTKKVITIAQVYKVPVTYLVKKAIEQMAADDGIKGSRFKSRINLDDDSWLAGVVDGNQDHQNPAEEDDDDEDYEPNDEEEDDEFNEDDYDDKDPVDDQIAGVKTQNPVEEIINNDDNDNGTL